MRLQAPPSRSTTESVTVSPFAAKRDFARGRQSGKGALVVDVPRQRGEVVGSEQAGERRLSLARVGEESAPVAVGHARGLDVPVEAHRACRSVRSVAERFELAQNHQRDQTRPVRRALPDVEPAPSKRDRLDELGAFKSVGEILFRLHPAGGLERRRHVGCDRPGVEGVGAALGDGAQRVGERRLDEPIALARRAAAGQKERVPGAAQLVLVHRPIPGHTLVHRKAVLRAADGGQEQFVEALGPVGVQQQLPAGDGAWDGDAVRRNVVWWSWPRGFDRVERSGPRRPAGAVDGDDLAAARQRVEAEAIAAESRSIAARRPRAPRRPQQPRRRRCRRRARPRSRSARRSAWRSPPSRSRNRRGCVRSDGSPAMTRPLAAADNQAGSICVILR